MDGAVKLRETRTLVLGVEVLLGCQLAAASQDGFHDLPATSKVGRLGFS